MFWLSTILPMSAAPSSVVRRWLDCHWCRHHRSGTLGVARAPSSRWRRCQHPMGFRTTEGGRMPAADLISRARQGDDDAFRALTEPHRRELHVHCYRMLGSVQDAEDVLQETLLAAWRGLDTFEERASIRTWLYRIATNRCLNALRTVGRR